MNNIPCNNAFLAEAKNGGQQQLVSENLSFSSFALNGRTEELRKKMDNDVYVIGRLAIRGQLTGIFAPPNGGKTLLVCNYSA